MRDKRTGPGKEEPSDQMQSDSERKVGIEVSLIAAQCRFQQRLSKIVSH